MRLPMSGIITRGNRQVNMEPTGSKRPGRHVLCVASNVFRDPVVWF